MKKIAALITAFAAVSIVALSGCEKQERPQQPGGQTLEQSAPSSTPTTTSPESPRGK